MIWEHRNYLATAGPLMIIVYLASSLLDRLSNKQIQLLPLGTFLLLLAILSFERSQVWSDQESLALHLAESNPDSFRSQSLLAQVYAANNNLQRANDVLSTLGEKSPQQVEIFSQQLAYNCDRPDVAEQLTLRLTHLLQSEHVSNHIISDLARLTLIANGGGCESVSPIVVLILLNAISLNPSLNEEPTHIGIVHLLAARNLLRLNRIEEAMNQYDLALKLDKSTAPWRISLEKARVLWRLGREEEALKLRELVLADYADEQDKFRFQNQLAALDQLISGN